MDSIGLGISKTKLMYFNIANFPIKGILCSSNDIGEEKVGIVNLDCFSIARGNTKFDGAEWSNIKSFCPENCADKKQEIYGNLIYKDDSSICRAAIHSGAITSKKGGLINIILAPGEPSYPPILSNDI